MEPQTDARAKAESCWRAQIAVSRIMAEDVCLSSVAPRVLAVLCDTFHFKVGELWTVDAATNVLRRNASWHAAPDALSAFESESVERVFSAGEGLPGRVWHSGAPAWVGDVAGDGNLPRAAAAVRDGLRAACGFPVLGRDGAVVGAVDFFGDALPPPDPQVVLLMASVGTQLGALAASPPAGPTHDVVLASLRASEERFSKAFHGSLALMSIGRLSDGRFVDVNDSFVRMLGFTRDEVVGRTAAELGIMDAEATAAVRATVRAGGILRDMEVRLRTKSGEERIVLASLQAVEVHGEPCSIGSAVDITERRRAQEQLVQAQKMDAVGQLAGGVAHDFNNLLGVITGYCELLERDIGPGHRGHTRLEHIKQAAERATSVTRQLLAFSRKQTLQPSVLDLNLVTAEAERMLRRLLGEDIRLATRLDPDLGRVRADPGQIELVVLNLALNARDAMPQGGQLLIETRNADLDEAFVQQHGGTRGGPHVSLSVTDTGHGMDAHTLLHMFEPFFTTKEVGKGTGLGLSTVFGIVKQSGGFMAVDSEPGRGSTLAVYLPRVFDEADAPAAAIDTASVPGGSETVLLVEDEALLRAVIAEALEDAGYKVLGTASPEEALARVHGYEAEIHLALLDVVMPHVSGPELAQRLLAQRPGTKVLFMSGYPGEALQTRGLDGGEISFLSKPFSSADLLRRVRETLDEPSLRV